MSRLFVCLIVLTVGAVTCVSECNAQIRARVRQRIAASLVPPVNPAAPPTAGPSAHGGSPAETPPAPPVRGGFLARRLQMRRDLVAQQAAQAQPTPAAPVPQQRQASQNAQQRTAQRRPLNALRQASAQVAPALRSLTQGQMSRMDLPELQSALADTNGNLANELNQFSSAASWQRFFNMPAGVVDEGVVDLAALQTALVRFENVAANPKFTQISSLPSFQQSRGLLTELVNRSDMPASVAPPSGDGPQLIDPASANQQSAENSETLPAPEPRLPRNSGEHSILLRTPKS
jgi:hypothetical protein